MGNTLQEIFGRLEIELSETEQILAEKIENKRKNNQLTDSIFTFLIYSKIIEEKNRMRKKERKLSQEYKKIEFQINLKHDKKIENHHLYHKLIITKNEIDIFSENKNKTIHLEISKFLKKYSEDRQFNKFCLDFYNNMRILRLDKISPTFKIAYYEEHPIIKQNLSNVIKNIQETYENESIEKSIFSEISRMIHDYDNNELTSFFDQTGNEIKEFQKHVKDQNMYEQFKKDFFVSSLE